MSNSLAGLCGKLCPSEKVTPQKDEEMAKRNQSNVSQALKQPAAIISNVVKKDIEEEQKNEKDLETIKPSRGHRERAKSYVQGKLQRLYVKLLDERYLKHKSVEDVLKKILKNLLRAMEASLQNWVIGLGRIFGKIICHLNPLPDLTLLSLSANDISIDVLHVKEETFLNYGETVRNVPRYMFFPNTFQELQQVVHFAKDQGKRVRCCGMRHSWTPVFADDDEILISLLPLDVTDTLTHVRSKHSMAKMLDNWKSEMRFIQFLRELPTEEGTKRKAAVRLGSALTNLELLKWSLENKWTLPWDIIAVMITYGGSNAMICHGAGIQSRSLSDLVLEMEFVNFLGEIQTVSDPELLRSAAGCFGLLGIVTSLTLKLDYMTYAEWMPRKTPMWKSIPKPGTGLVEEELRLKKLCEESYYAEFFWFPANGSTEGYWENCWRNDGREEDSQPLNDQLSSDYQVASTFLFDLCTDVLVPAMEILHDLDANKEIVKLVRKVYSSTVSKAGVGALPESEIPLITPLVEALHFRQGFHYISVREMELSIPIPSTKDGEPDWSIVQRAWWDAIEIIDKSYLEHKFACDMTLEMRVMGSSDSTLAPYRGNKNGTVCIEPVSTSVVPNDVWEDFKVEMANKWSSYVDADGTPLRMRPHWAKENPRTVFFDGQVYTGTDYLKMIYTDEIQEFATHLNTICQAGGYSLSQVKSLFSNYYLDNVFEKMWAEQQ
ncbi:uncharacterized protein LOC131890329 [Tigriopus californicus]|uniref:uncharacterized protein LOC131890329 n=1 Tax=Tigriopus californicus TaxID=6832 RepID=UPI0027DA8B65|nr:uncharacterized protein LOC131890329 [Tigriopus californicus]